ncbi:MAG: dihydropteroate synthase [Cyanobacteria bacterium P01_F01_bin.42]
MAMTNWNIRGTDFSWGERTYVMGILNVTPDSFSDGGDFFELDSSLRQAKQFVQAGVDIIDIGGQSSRPNADEISPEEEMRRVVPVIEQIRDGNVHTPISIDTTRSQVAKAALAAGADIINDISGGLEDPQILAIAAQTQAPLILMHRRGNAKTMQQMTDYGDLIGEIQQYFEQQIQRGVDAGIKRDLIAIDPGIGFAKTGAQNIELLKRLQDFQALDCPILVGTSRKSFIGQILDQPEPKRRVWGTAASCCAAIANGADILRVHDVEEMIQVSRVADAVWR